LDCFALLKTETELCVLLQHNSYVVNDFGNLLTTLCELDSAFQPIWAENYERECAVHTNQAVVKKAVMQAIQSAQNAAAEADRSDSEGEISESSWGQLLGSEGDGEVVQNSGLKLHINLR
jgi:hypothetical protein